MLIGARRFCGPLTSTRIPPCVRQTLRARSRYEVQNNSYARGLVTTLANDNVGNGPRLQYLSSDDALNERIEHDFAAWSETINLAAKLRTIRAARCQDGEAFVILAQNPALATPVKLDLQIIEAARVTSDPAVPLMYEDGSTPRICDGITYDRYGNPKSYRVAQGALASEIAAKNMIHVFRQERPEQLRGIPELSAALPLFAQLRRYTAAVLASAEKCAEFAAILYTDNPSEGQAAPIEALDSFDIEYNKLTTMPEGWKMNELYVKPPLATYADFKRELISEIGAAFGVPYAIAAGTSSGFTYASAKLDHETYYRSITNERGFIEDAVLNRVFVRWLTEWRLANAISIEICPWEHQWLWSNSGNLDRLTAARVTAMSLKNNTTTLATEYARQGKNWKTELAQIEKERKVLERMGLV